MWGLVKKDLLLLKAFMKSFLITMTIFVLLSWANKSLTYFSGMFGIYSLTLVFSTFSLDETTSWNAYALSLGVTRKELVNSKYLLLLTVVVPTTVFNFIISFSMAYGLGMTDYVSLIVSVITLACLSVILILIFLPILFKYGTEKSRILLMGVGALPFLLIFLAQYITLPNFTVQQIETFIKILPIFVLLLLVIVAAISFYSSHKVIKNHEF